MSGWLIPAAIVACILIDAMLVGKLAKDGYDLVDRTDEAIWFLVTILPPVALVYLVAVVLYRWVRYG